MKGITVFLVVSVLLCSGILIASATEWPQWRGPNRDGISDEVDLLKEWSLERSQDALEDSTWRGIFWNLRFSGTCLYDVLQRG